jgi:hypothetical protein
MLTEDHVLQERYMFCLDGAVGLRCRFGNVKEDSVRGPAPRVVAPDLWSRREALAGEVLRHQEVVFAGVS